MQSWTIRDPLEIDFLLSQALRVGPSELDSLNRLKFVLIQSSILGRALSNESIDFNDLTTIAKELAKSITAIDEAFGDLEDFNFENSNEKPDIGVSPATLEVGAGLIA